VRILLEQNHQAHPGAIRLVAHIAHTIDLTILGQFRNPFLQSGLVDLIGQLGDHDVEGAALRLFDMCLGPQRNLATTGGVGRP
jgi:hypothetical protein